MFLHLMNNHVAIKMQFMSKKIVAIINLLNESLCMITVGLWTTFSVPA